MLNLETFDLLGPFVSEALDLKGYSSFSMESPNGFVFNHLPELLFPHQYSLKRARSLWSLSAAGYVGK